MPRKRTKNLAPWLRLGRLLFAALLCQAAAQAKADDPPIDFERYQLVLLMRGEGASAIQGEALVELQKKHLAHLGAMAASGKLLVAGPFADQRDPAFRGMCLYRAGSIDEARRLAEADPAVVAGRLRVEVLTWMVEKGALAFPKAAPPAAAR
jgi:hypothetical protein